MLSNFYSEYGGFEGYKNALTDWAGSYTNKYFSDGIKENFLYISCYQYYGFGTSAGGSFVQRRCLTIVFDVDAENVYVYDEAGVLKHAKPYVYNSSGALKAYEVTAFLPLNV